MDKYKTIDTKLGWLGIWQTSLNFKNIFIIHWCFICSKLAPSKELGFTFLGLPFWNHNALLSFRFFDWGSPKNCYVGFGFLFFNPLEFRIGNSKSWLWIRFENVYGWYFLRKSNDTRL